jgi:hypothetical protein
MLKFYYECEVMAVKNQLEAGIANGSQLLVDKNCIKLQGATIYNTI